MTVRTAALPAIAIALTLAACGGGEADDARPTSTFVAGLGFTQVEASAAAEQALLRLEDFPTGWTERPVEDDEDSGPDLPPECQEPEYAGKVGDADSQEFLGPDEEEVEHGVTVYVDEAAARQAVAVGVEYLEECREPLADAMKTLIEDSDDAPVDDFAVEVNIDRLSFPSYGDESVAWRISVTVTSEELPFDIDFFLDVLGVRVDRIVSGITFVNLLDRPDTDMEEGLMGIIEGRAGSAAAALE